MVIISLLTLVCCWPQGQKEGFMKALDFVGNFLASYARVCWRTYAVMVPLCFQPYCFTCFQLSSVHHCLLMFAFVFFYFGFAQLMWTSSLVSCADVVVICWSKGQIVWEGERGDRQVRRGGGGGALILILSLFFRGEGVIGCLTSQQHTHTHTHGLAHTHAHTYTHTHTHTHTERGGGGGGQTDRQTQTVNVLGREALIGGGSSVA